MFFVYFNVCTEKSQFWTNGWILNHARGITLGTNCWQSKGSFWIFMGSGCPMFPRNIPYLFFIPDCQMASRTSPEAHFERFGTLNFEWRSITRFTTHWHHFSHFFIPESKIINLEGTGNYFIQNLGCCLILQNHSLPIQFHLGHQTFPCFLLVISN